MPGTKSTQTIDETGEPNGGPDDRELGTKRGGLLFNRDAELELQAAGIEPHTTNLPRSTDTTHQPAGLQRARREQGLMPASAAMKR